MGSENRNSSIDINLEIRTVQEIFVLLDLEFGITDLGPTEDLIEDGHIDSLAIVELVVLLEEAFDLVIDDGDVTPEHFSTVAAIAAFIDRSRS